VTGPGTLHQLRIFRKKDFETVGCNLGLSLAGPHIANEFRIVIRSIRYEPLGGDVDFFVSGLVVCGVGVWLSALPVVTGMDSSIKPNTIVNTQPVGYLKLEIFTDGPFHTAFKTGDAGFQIHGHAVRAKGK
jgi:hypothetical protein